MRTVSGAALPEAGDGRRLDEEVPEAVLSEAGRIRRLQLFVRSFDENAGTRSVLRPALLEETDPSDKVSRWREAQVLQFIRRTSKH